MKLLPVIICLDVEPDERDFDLKLRAPWAGFVETYKFFSNLRPSLELATGSAARFSWFLRMDPQVESGYGSPTWVIDQYPEIVSELQMRQDEIGLHIHAERWDQTSGEWVGDYEDQEWVTRCVRTSFDAFEDAFQRPCKAVSFGDRWSNHETVALLETLGAEFFLSIEPGARPSGEELVVRYTGQWPNYGRAPSDIYRPHAANYLESQSASNLNIWMIPLSAGKYEGPKAFRLWRLKRLAKSLGIDFKPQRESTTLRLHIPLEIFAKTVEGLLKISNASHLSLVLRSDACIRPTQRANVEANCEYLRNHPQVRNFRFVTPAETIKMLGLN